jgi:BirA family biotin operon repressor/biotin-[acetyl-CoA-carboxylase] ligase
VYRKCGTVLADQHGSEHQTFPALPDGWTLHYEPKTASTQDQARAAALAKAGSRHVFWTDFQSAGRGQRGRAWTAPPGSALLTTLLLREGLAPFANTMLASIALCEGIQETTGVSCQIKWPNDLIIADQKVAGVLTETSDAAPGYVAIGSGVNLIWPAERPPEVPAWATALSQHTTATPSPGLLLQRYIERVDAWLAGFEILKLRLAWNNRLWSRGTIVSVRQGTEHLVGRLQGAREDGALLIETDADGVVPVVTGEIALPGQVR